MPEPEPVPVPELRRTWSVSQRNALPPSQPANNDLFSLATPASDGYEKWQAEKQARQREFEQAWGIRLKHKVRVQLRNERTAREGIIHLLDDLPDHLGGDHRPALRLRIGNHHFVPTQIESLSVIA